MKRLIAFASALLIYTVAIAQNPLDLIREQLAKGRIELTYSFKSTGKVPVSGSGTLTVDGNCYRLKGNGLDIRCDGKAKWIVDDKAKEVYIEESKGVEDFLSDPEIYASLVKDIKMSESEITGKFHDSGSGDEISFKLNNFKHLTGGSDEIFRFDTSALGSEWLVTDTR